METPVVRSRGRPRKRSREDIMDKSKTNVEGDIKAVGENANNQEIMSSTRKRGRPPKRRHVEIRGQALVSRYVMKEFEGSGVFVGKVVSYDTGLYRVEYEDGDFEDLDSGELREYLIGNECEVFVGSLLERKKKLDEHVAKKMGLKSGDELEKVNVAELTPKPDERDVGNVQHDAVKVEMPMSSAVSGDEVDDDDSDSLSDSCEYGKGWETRSETEIPTVPSPELPPSSGNIGVPEEYVSHLFSVYGFLRSFSIRLFLSPFRLDDLVGCLNCTVRSTLLDSIHVALLRALRRHLETLASDGSELASKCLRCIDWGLLDMLTWPVYLVHYLMTMGHLHGSEWNGFYTDVMEKDYCTLPVGTKLTVLQILCDYALDNAEIRAEIDMRQESEIGLDSDGFTSLESEPRKDYPRSRKNSLTMKSNDHNRDTVNVDEDGNGDECCLCGMDGMLLCCDGCPSAYHSRCIGVNKLSIPEGEWLCPECTIRRTGPAITTGTLLRGAEVFGVDSYAQLFVGTCDHLLVQGARVKLRDMHSYTIREIVCFGPSSQALNCMQHHNKLKVSVKTSPFVRYYSIKDIVKVVTVLCSTPHHAALYVGICESILKYWGLPQSVIPPFINSQTSMTSENRGETIVQSTQVHPLGENGSHEVKLENYSSGLGGSFLGNVSGSSIEKLSSSVPMETDLASMVGISGAVTAQNPSNMISKPVEQAEPSCSGQGLADRPSIAGNMSCISWNDNENTAGNNNGVFSPKKFCMHGKGDTDVGRRTDKKRNNTCLYMGTSFKPHAYINQFVHGDYAASAAANFAVLLSDENRASDIHASDPRKVMAANVSLQIKGFTSAAVRFFWPSTEKKLMEVPRERCSWCLNCKASVISRKACLLNQAALNATRAAMKFFSSCRLAKNVEDGLYSISIYILFMEESLLGLILGPFRSEAYRQEWCKKVEEGSTCSDMKSCLLELEGNLSTIALSSEWTKLVDNWMNESAVPQSACPTTSTQKRGPGRRRKHLAAAGATPDDSNDKLSDINWWRGGKLSKLVFKRATLPSSVLKKAARQGGSRRIPGVYYPDSSDVPKRSRQFIWRAAVEMARNASQLALQVRYLDHHIKWSDLVRPEQTVQDGKGSESDASAFRNALICDKKVIENKISYGVAFGNQKHLSSRLMKSIIEKEEGQDGKDKYWFSEIRVPLYLIKEYEEKTEKTLSLPPKGPPKGSLPLSKLQQKQVRAFRRNVFHYLDYKRDNLSMCRCASCHQDVLIDSAVTCNACGGYCHKKCTSSSTVLTDEDVEFVTMCKQCSDNKVVNQNNSSVDSPTSPLALQGLEYHNSAIGTKTAGSKSISQQHQNSATASKSARLKSKSQQLLSCGTSETPSNKKLSLDSYMTKNKKRPCNWGLIWKKKDAGDGSDFRLKNVLYRGNLHEANALNPACHMCKKPYNPELMYICCEACHYWFHADAVELDESKLPNLVGFKCCRCRRIKSPVCPYADPDVKKTTVKKLVIRGPKEEAVLATSVSEVMSEHAESVPATPISAMEDDVFIQVDDPFSLSVSKVEQIPEPKAEVEWDVPSGPAPQKLRVRRQGKNEKEADDAFAVNVSLVQCTPYVQTKNSINPPLAEWDGGLEDGTTFDYESLNFENPDYEPQTYFSYTELLETDAGNKFEDGGALETFYNWPCENSSSGFLNQCELGPTVDNLPIKPREPAGCLPCNMCSQTAPAPDLSCQNCGLKIHSHCSPWEELSKGKSWSCGNCRAWC